MDISIRKAVQPDAEKLLAFRMDFLRQLTGEEPLEALSRATQKYLNAQIGSDRMICYLAANGLRIVSGVICCLYDVIPKRENPGGKVGYLFNVYTLREYRRRGLCEKLLRETIDEAKRLGAGELYLNATDDGLGIYQKLGFLPIDKEMRLAL